MACCDVFSFLTLSVYVLYILALDTLSLWRWDFAWLSCFVHHGGFRVVSIFSFCLPNYSRVALGSALMSVLGLGSLKMLAFLWWSVLYPLSHELDLWTPSCSHPLLTCSQVSSWIKHCGFNPSRLCWSDGLLKQHPIL